MTKRKISALILCAVSLCSLAMTTARAQPRLIATDGCALLGELIVNQLTLRRWFGDSGSGPLLSDSGRVDVMICNQTARTVTSAFATALAEMNIEVAWNPDQRFGGVACHSADVSQCNPDSFPFPGAAAGDQVFVLHSWQAVQKAIAVYMPLGAASDTIRFSASGLGVELNRSFEYDISGKSRNFRRAVFSR